MDSSKDQYIQIWLTYRNTFEQYTGDQVKNLIMAMLDYKGFGKDTDFEGEERFAWGLLKAGIDASNSRYERRCEANRVNGQKGGRPKKETDSDTAKPKKPTGFSENHSVSEETQKTDGFSEETEKPNGFEEKPKTQDKIRQDRLRQDRLSEDTTRTSNVVGVVGSPIQLDADVSAVISYYTDKVDATASSYVLDQLSSFVPIVSKDCCILAIDIALGERKYNWSYIRGILRNMEKDGIDSLEKWQAAEEERRKRGGNDDGTYLNRSERYPEHFPDEIVL